MVVPSVSINGAKKKRRMRRRSEEQQYTAVGQVSAAAADLTDESCAERNPKKIRTL